MSQKASQVEIIGKMIASPLKTKSEFDEKSVELEARANKPVLLVFSANYRWEEQRDDKLNDWDFYLEITDDQGGVIHSEYKHYGEDEPGFVGKDEESYRAYLEEESYLKYYKPDDNLKRGEGTMVRSLKTPDKPGRYMYRCRLVAQFWARKLGEDRGLEKNKTESRALCTVIVKVT
jgi:hypothetical protein